MLSYLSILSFNAWSELCDILIIMNKKDNRKLSFKVLTYPIYLMFVIGLFVFIMSLLRNKQRQNIEYSYLAKILDFILTIFIIIIFIKIIT